MRPPEFTGGKKLPVVSSRGWEEGASMRPPEFTGGKARQRSIRPSAVSMLQ